MHNQIISHVFSGEIFKTLLNGIPSQKDEALFQALLKKDSSALFGRDFLKTCKEVLSLLTFGKEDCILAAENFFELSREFMYATGEFKTAFLSPSLSLNAFESSGREGVVLFCKIAYLLFLKKREKKYFDYLERAAENVLFDFSAFLYQGEKGIFVEKYASCRAEGENVSLTLECNFPESDRGSIVIERAKEPFLLFLRIPDWAGEVEIEKNGKKLRAFEQSGYLVLSGEEKDRISFRFPVEFALKGLPGAIGFFSLSFGGRVLVSDRSEAQIDSLYSFFDSPSSYLESKGDEFILKAEEDTRFCYLFEKREGFSNLYLRYFEK